VTARTCSDCPGPIVGRERTHTRCSDCAMADRRRRGVPERVRSAPRGPKPAAKRVMRGEIPRGHRLPIAGDVRRDCALELACEMAHETEHGRGVPSSCPVPCGWAVPAERLDVGDYVYRPGTGAGALAHVEAEKRLRPDYGKGLPTGYVPRQRRAR